MDIPHHQRFPEQHALAPFRICGELYFIGDEDVCSYLLRTSDGLIIIDTGYPTAQGLLIHSIYTLGFDPRDIRLILHSHGHYDHFGATRLLQSLSGAETCLGRADAEMFLHRPELALREDHLPYSWTELFTVAHPLRDGEVLRLGDTEILVLETPGHSDGTVSYFFDVHENGRTYRVGLLGGAGMNTMHRSFYETFGAEGYHRRFLATLRRLQGIGVDIALGTHTAQFCLRESRKALLSGSGSNPFIAPERWNDCLQAMEQALLQRIEEENLPM